MKKDYLVCDGSLVDSKLYPELAALMLILPNLPNESSGEKERYTEYEYIIRSTPHDILPVGSVFLREKEPQ